MNGASPVSGERAKKHGISHWTKRGKWPLSGDKVKETLVIELSLVTQWWLPKNLSGWSRRWKNTQAKRAHRMTEEEGYSCRWWYYTTLNGD
jgi:hypothetical protein